MMLAICGWLFLNFFLFVPVIDRFFACAIEKQNMTVFAIGEYLHGVALYKHMKPDRIRLVYSIHIVGLQASKYLRLHVLFLVLQPM